MNKVATISLSAVGLSALFAVAFVGFAKVNGAPLHTLPVVGSLFPEQAHADPDVHAAADDHAATDLHASTSAPAGHAPETVAPPDQPEEHARPQTPAEAIAERSNGARAGIFEVLDADALYGQEELRALADALRAKNRTADQRNADLDRREDLLQDRLTALEERRRTLDEFAKQLDARERELAARETEAGRDETTGNTLGGLPAGELATFFADGELEVLAQRLSGFTPADTAQILARLSPARAKELLDALPAARWRECAEAYALAVQQAAEAPAAPATRP